MREDVVYPGNCRELYEEITLIHQSLPGISHSDLDTSTVFLGYRLNYPIVIEAMTGGHPDLKPINEKLAKLASQYRIAIGVGSQRPIIKSGFNKEVVESYSIVRETAVDVPVIGNIGIAQLNELSIDDVKKLVEVIEADALAIHLNPAQEMIQPEGDVNFRDDLLSKIKMLVKELDVPIIIKEVGNGLSMETVAKFRELEIKIFDVAGTCGTDWVKIEALRNPENSVSRVVGFTLSEAKWGIPTPLSLIEARYAAPDATIVASGGVWSGVVAAKLIALGGDLVGAARPFLKALLEHGEEGLRSFLDKYIGELKAVMFLTGSRTLRELRYKPIVLGLSVRNYLEQRGINVYKYLEIYRRGVVA